VVTAVALCDLHSCRHLSAWVKLAIKSVQSLIIVLDSETRLADPFIVSRNVRDRFVLGLKPIVAWDDSGKGIVTKRDNHGPLGRASFLDKMSMDLPNVGRISEVIWVCFRSLMMALGPYRIAAGRPTDQDVERVVLFA
jgi:hypothetical protein